MNKTIGFAALAIALPTTAAAATIALSCFQIAMAIGDPGIRSASPFAPGVVKQDLNETNSSLLAQRAYGGPNDIGEPGAIGDSSIRIPSLIK